MKPEAKSYITGSNARDLQVITRKSGAPPTRPFRFAGSEQQCREIIALAVRRWYSLPHGREIEEAARLHSEQPLDLNPPAPASTAARRRSGGAEVAVSLL